MSTTQDTGAAIAESDVAPTKFRGDIDGLRAIAILLIVGFHVGLSGFDGGFIGVDVFFVISGYLITRNLLAGGDRVRLLRFWARRIRRLVPALSLMVLVTLVAAFVILAVVEREQVAKEAASAVLYVSNIFFAHASQDYFAADVNESPFLHTWSLGVEEQFYIVWPLLFAGCAVAFRRPELRRRALIVGFAVILVGSFALNLRLTDQLSPWAFFSLPTRAWEFAVAGLLAALGAPRLFKGVALRTVAAAFGLGLLAWATLAFSADTPYPGSAALLPVLGTLLLLIAGDVAASEHRQGVVSVALATAPMQWIGRVSYSWYLWHWPFIILTVAALGDDRVRYRGAAALVSLFVAYLTHRLVENPIRFNRKLTLSVRRTFAMGGAATVVVLVVAVGVALMVGEPASSSIDAKLAAARGHTYPCFPVKTPTGVDYCTGGDTQSDKTVLFIGDSHAGVWMDVMAQTATERGYGLAIRISPGCPAIPVETKFASQGQLTPEQCRKAHDDLVTLVDELDPVAVFVTQSNGYIGNILDDSGSVPDEQTRLAIWEAGYRELLTNMRSAGVPVAVILDNPTFKDDPYKCIARERAVDPCVSSRQDALALTGPARDADKRVIQDFGGVATFDPVEVLCDSSTCALEMNDALVYGDTNHLSAAAMVAMKPNIAKLWSEVLP